MFRCTLTFDIDRGVGAGLCVLPKHNWVVISYRDAGELHVHSLLDGSLVRKVGEYGHGKGQFAMGWSGMCASPDNDTVLVAEFLNRRLQQVSVFDGSWIRFVGEGVLDKPNFVDCNKEVIVVSEASSHTIRVFSWADGSEQSRIGQFGLGKGQLFFPTGVCLLADGTGVVIADRNNHRLCVFTVSGKYLYTVGSDMHGLDFPDQMVECPSDDSFVVWNSGREWLEYNHRGFSIVHRDGRVKNIVDTGINHDNREYPILASLPAGGIVVRNYSRDEFDVPRVAVFHRPLQLRFEWLRVCFTHARRL